MAVKLIARRDIKEIFPKEFSNRSLIGRFIDYIMNNFFQSSSEELVNGYIGKKTVALEEGDYYLPEPSSERQVYQLNPSLVSVDNNSGEILTVVEYCNFINTLKKQGCITNDQNRLLSNTYWSWCPPINVDMFLNYNYYYWVEEGPTIIEINDETNVVLDILGKTQYTYEYNDETIDFTNGLKVIFKNDVNEEYNNKPYIIEGVGSAIRLVDDSIILKGKTNNPDYFVMERGCQDGNSWSRRNRWFHRSLISSMDNSNGIKIIQAARPIICFNRDIELYNYGVYNRGYIDLIYNGNKADLHGQSALVTIDNKVYKRSVQGIDLVDGVYVLITGDSNEENNNIIYQVTGTESTKTIILQPVLNGLNIETGKPVIGEGVTVKSNNSDYSGKYFYFNSSKKWVEGQEKKTENQSPLFNLYDEDKQLLNSIIYYPDSSFKGNRLFDYSTPEEAGVQDTSKIEIDEYLNKKIITSSYGNYIFNNVLDTEKYTYWLDTEGTLTEYNRLRFYKVNKDLKLDESNNIDFSNSEYKNNWHISNNIISQYITTEITVTDNQEKVFKNEEEGIKKYYTSYNLAYKPDESETQISTYVYLNGNLLNSTKDYIVESDNDNTYLLISPSIELKKEDVLYIKLLVSKIDGELVEGYYYDLPLSLTANG